MVRKIEPHLYIAENMTSRERDKASGLTFETQFGKPVAVCIQSSNIKKCIAYMKEHALENVIINSEHNYKLQHLDFLKENTFITSVEIETDIADCSALNFLCGLRNLALHYSENVVDFSNFSKLANLNLTWNKNFINITKCSRLKELALWEYPDKNLLFIKAFPKLEELNISNSKIQDLDGIGYCKKLKRLTLRRNRNLESIDSLTKTGKTMVELVIIGSKKLTNYNPVGKSINLKSLYLLDCGAAPDVNFVKNLNVLDCGSFNIDIADGQVSALLKRPIIFKNHKHFTHKNNLRFKMNSEGKFELARTTSGRILCGN